MSGILVKLAAVVAGAALLSTSPAAASYSISEDGSPPARRVSAPRSEAAPGRGAATPVLRSSSLEVSIPRVAFTADVRVVNGRLRTPVLVNVAAAPGIVRVSGSRGACVERLAPGQVAWIDCEVRSRGAVVIVVTLRDGTAATRVVRR